MSAILGHGASKSNAGDRWHYLGNQNLLSTRLMIKIKRAASYRHIDRAGGVVRDGAWHELEDNSCRQG